MLTFEKFTEKSKRFQEAMLKKAKADLAALKEWKTKEFDDSDWEIIREQALRCSQSLLLIGTEEAWTLEAKLKEEFECLLELRKQEIGA